MKAVGSVVCKGNRSVVDFKYRKGKVCVGAGKASESNGFKPEVLIEGKRCCC